MTTLFGVIDVETPKYNILKKETDFEIRRYDPCIMATTSTSSWSEGSAFRRLANYIFGNKQEKIAMTAPVISTDRTMSFVLPSKYKLSNLPAPENEVKLEELDELTLAVRQFSWSASESNVQTERDVLENALRSNGIKYKPKLFVFQYNPPWCLPFLRTNEVAFEVE